MTRSEVIAYLDAYARSFAAPVETGVTVTAIERDGARFRVTTDRGSWTAAAVVVATGHSDQPAVPAFAAGLPDDVVQVVPSRYRNPRALPRGGVLVVGASATGVQLAAEIHRSGRPVTIAVGRHARLPRTYRGRDIMRWLDAAGVLEDRAEDARDLAAARRQPSLQLVGTPERRPLDLGVLQDLGVRLAGRALAAEGGRVLLADDLEASLADADARLARLLRRIDAHVARTGERVPPPEPVRAIRPAPAPTAIDLRAEGVRTVLWATGYRRSYPWLKVPVLDARGEIRHEGGITPEPGLYVLGLQFLRRRSSSWIDGVGDDARALADDLVHRTLRRAA
jgi:putative flavoprotein involved in K+ transport